MPRWKTRLLFAALVKFYVEDRKGLLANKDAGQIRIIYNFPLVAGGIDLTSDDIVDIARAAPNIRGIMLS